MSPSEEAGQGALATNRKARHDYQILDNGFEVARVTKEWAGFSRAFMGHSRYVLSIDPRVNRPSRPLILGTAVALDLIRMKGSGSSST